MIDAHATASHGRNSLRFIVRLRWLLLLSSPFMLELSRAGFRGAATWFVLASFALCNLLLHRLARRESCRLTPRTWIPVFLTDIALISIMVSLRGGLRSDSYLLYLLSVCEAAILLRRREAWAVGGVALIAYTLVVALLDGPGELGRVAIRSMYLGAVGLAATFLASSERRALEASLTDAKTNLPNARLFQEALREAVEHHSRAGVPLAVGIVDVDNFRQLNAAIGHPLADQVLEQMADRLLAWKRPQDLIARYGGEEFVFLMPGLTVAQGWQRIEELRTQIAETAFHVSGRSPVFVTVSGGVAGLTECRTTPALLVRADAALLEAKATGKNRILQA